MQSFARGTAQISRALRAGLRTLGENIVILIVIVTGDIAAFGGHAILLGVGAVLPLLGHDMPR